MELQEYKMNKKTKTDQDLFYNCEQINAIGKTFNFILGTRSKGKTFGWTRFCIKRFLEQGEEFVYIRRYREDLDIAMKTFFSSVQNKFKGHEFFVKKDDNCYLLQIDKKTMGYAIALTQAQKFKSTNLSKVCNIIFDEFLQEDGRYIGGSKNSQLDCHMFFSLYSSIARGYNEFFRDNVRCFLIANTVSIANPYFLYCHLTGLIRSDSKLIKTSDGYCIQIMKDKEIAERIKSTQAGQALARTSYFGYAYSGDMLLDNNNLIGKPLNGDGWYMCTIKVDGKAFGVRECTNDGIIYVNNKIDKDCNAVYTLTKADHEVNTIMLKRFSEDNLSKTIKKAYRMGNILFDNLECKKAFEDIMMM